MRRLATLLIALSAFAPVARAQTLADIDSRDAAVYAAWQLTPLTIQKSFFVTDATGFGQYTQRGSNVFKPGEKLVAYCEPVGYGWKDTGGGVYQFGFAIDLTVKSSDGKVVAQQQDFAKTQLQSHARNREFMVLLTLTLNGAPAGDYVLEYRLRDLTSDKSTLLDLPFKIGG